MILPAVQPATRRRRVYICGVSDPLYNPVYHALLSGDRHLSQGAGTVSYFDEAISPYVGFPETYSEGFDELFTILPAGRLILYATPLHLSPPGGWQLLRKARGLQMVLTDNYRPAPVTITPVPLQEAHVEQMLELAELTKPGPFGPRTILFGHYYGIFDGNRLVAMTGQRLHVQHFTEVSAVCTHPAYLGRGYAFALLQHQIDLIRAQGQTPFLHVRKDNRRAINLYHRIGFGINGPMNFYFMKRRSRRRVLKNKSIL